MSIEQGFAIRRNGSCLAGIEVGCGGTANGMVGCCPNGFQCPHAYNIDCCPVGTNCTMEIVETPKCSNSSWDLYDNGGYFCCEHGLPAYNNSGTNICASPGSASRGVLLGLIQAGSTIVSSSSIAPSISSTSVLASISESATTTPAQSSATSPPPQDESSTPVGAIAGGVVGGIAGLAILVLVAWLLIRRKRKNNAHNPYHTPEKAEMDGGDGVLTPLHQLDDTPRSHEMEAGKVTYAHNMTEMPAQSAPVELSAEHHVSR